MGHYRTRLASSHPAGQHSVKVFSHFSNYRFLYISGLKRSIFVQQICCLKFWYCRLNRVNVPAFTWEEYLSSGCAEVKERTLTVIFTLTFLLFDWLSITLYDFFFFCSKKISRNFSLNEVFCQFNVKCEGNFDFFKVFALTSANLLVNFKLRS